MSLPKSENLKLGNSEIVGLARRALPLMDADSRAEAEQLIAELSTENVTPDSLADFTRRAAAAFEADMQPVCNAIVSALHANDTAALKGLRALLPHLLEQVNRDPSLSDLLAHQLGKSLLDGMHSDGAATSMSPNDSLTQNAFNPAQKRIPKGQPGAGRFESDGPTDPNALGKGVARARKLLDADLQAAGIDTDTDIYRVTERLRARLKVKNPVHIMQRLSGISGAAPSESAMILKNLQDIFDMVPPRVLNGHGKNVRMPNFHVRVVDDPHSGEAGNYDARSHVLTLNRALGGASKRTIYHEMGHYLHFHGPEANAAAIRKHYQARTHGEALQNRGQIVAGELVEFKRDKFVTDYAARQYRWETRNHPKGQGVELPSVHLEHLGSGFAGFHAKSHVPNSDYYRDTMAAALAIFYHGRPKK